MRELRFCISAIGFSLQSLPGGPPPSSVAPGVARRRSQIHPPARVQLSTSEMVQARMLSKWAIRLHVRQEAAELLEHGADPNHLADLRVSTTTSLHGHRVACDRWGASSAEACRLAQRRVRAAGLIDSALYLAVLYDTGVDAPPPIFLGHASGLGSPGLAWSPSSGVDPSILVKRYPPPEQMLLWDDDGVSWKYWSEVRASETK